MQYFKSIFVIVITLCFLSFFLYIFSFVPFLGVEVPNYLTSLLVVSCSVIGIFIGAIAFHSIVRKSTFFQSSLIKFIILFIYSYAIFFLIDSLFTTIEVVFWMKLIFAFPFSFALKEDIFRPFGR